MKCVDFCGAVLSVLILGFILVVALVLALPFLIGEKLL